MKLRSTVFLHVHVKFIIIYHFLRRPVVAQLL